MGEFIPYNEFDRNQEDAQDTGRAKVILHRLENERDEIWKEKVALDRKIIQFHNGETSYNSLAATSDQELLSLSQQLSDVLTLHDAKLREIRKHKEKYNL